MQRLLDTGELDDIALVPGNTYEAGFEVHLWEYTTRDHYVSFPQTVSLGGAGAVAGGTNACVDRHKVRVIDPAPPVMDAGTMETLTSQRGGVWRVHKLPEYPGYWYLRQTKH